MIQSSARKTHEMAKKKHTKTYCLITTKNLVKKLGDIGLTPAPSSWWGLKLINGVKVTWGAGVRSYTTTLGPLIQGQTRTAKIKSAYNSLIIGPRGLGW